MASVDWDNAFDTHPVGTDYVADGDNRIMDTRQTVRDLLETEHDAHQINADYTDTGRHKAGSARVFFEKGSTAAPDNLLVFSNAGAWPPDPADVSLDKQGASSDLDNGRLWVDWDTGQLWFYEMEDTPAAGSDGAGNWTDINTNYNASADGWISIYPRTWSVENVADNNNQQCAVVNTREGIDCAAGPGGDLGVSITVPDDGKDYEIVVEATCTYYAAAGRSIGFWLVQDDGAPADMDYKLVYQSGGNMCGEATLACIQDTTVNGTTYEYTVEFCADAALSNNAVVNPEEGVGSVPALIGDFNGECSYSYVKATLKPLLETADYAF